MQLFHILLHIWRSFARPQVKTDCKTQFNVKENSNLKILFPLIDIFSHIYYPIFGNLSKVVETILSPPISLSYLKGCHRNFGWLFYKNMKNAFNKGLPYITHFVVFDQFLRRPKLLLTSIRHLTLIKTNLIKKKNSLLFQINFKQFHIFGAYNKSQCVITLYGFFSW